MPTADELMELARACAGKLDIAEGRVLPTLEEVEEQAGEEYEVLLGALQQDDVLGGVDLRRQRELAEKIEAALPPSDRAMVDELMEQHTRQVWLLQEAAYHVGLAVGLRLAEENPK